MESDFQSCSLADIYDFASGLSKARSEFGAGHPFLGFKDVFYNSAVPKELKELVRSTEQERVKCSVRRGDVFLTRTSETMNELGMSCVALNDIPFATFNGFTKRLRPKNEGVIAPEYARYYFRSWAFRSEVNSMATMSTRASLNNEILSRLSISFPPLEEQQAIGNILGTLDEKIELNRKINETLEGIAKALFKSWFIDFDPVRAMEEGRPTGLSDEISELFSDSFEQSELGEIPSGWTFEKASDLYQVTIGKTPPRKESWWFSDSDQDIPWLSIKDMGNAFVYAMETSEYLTRDAVNTFNVRIVPRGAVLVSFKLTVGRVAIAPSEMLTNEAIAHFAPLGESIPASYSYCLLSSYDYASLGSTSSIATAVNSKMLREMRLLNAPGDLKKAFDQMMSPVFLRIQQVIAQTKLLEESRDALLPRLISGELRVPDAEKMLEEVGV